jgi:hypothetical protein
MEKTRGRKSRATVPLTGGYSICVDLSPVAEGE